MKREVRVAPESMSREVLAVIENREEMESRVTYRLVNRKNVRPDGNEIYDTWKGDMVIVYRIDINEKQAAVIGEAVLYNQFNGDIDKVRKLARENTPRLFPAIFLGMKEQLERICGFTIDVDEGPEKMYVLTNRTGINGATCILYPDIHRVIREKVNGAYYIIPSSIHELIIVPAAGIEYEDLNRIIGDANTEQVAEFEQLGDKALYVSEDNVIGSGDIIERINFMNALINSITEEIFK